MVADYSSRVVRVLDDYLEQVARGTPPDKDVLLAEHPELAESLAACLSGLELVQAAARDQAAMVGRLAGEIGPAADTGALGDFRLLREIGRGGMGIVYEALQRSLSRRVALKILPFAGMLDPRGRQRFLNEAHAAARLNHPNIIDVFAVGCERGVHYYAMRLVEGPTLAEVIDQLRAAGRTNHRPLPQAVADLAGWNSAAVLAEATTLLHRPTNGDQSSGRNALPPSSSAPQPNQQAMPSDTAAPADLSTWASRPGSAFFRCVAEVGVQIARALDYAHEVGIIHRDIKPSNLIADAHGKVWLTDFGLARLDTNAELTMTGDLLGTLRYMSPEQVLGQPAAVDHRSDIYSLGATLYELLTLRPAFPAGDRAELLRRICVAPPKSPRKLTRSLPIELETIVLKALEKEPADRYGTAGELADDLQRFLDNRPIHARRSRVAAHAKAFWRRHQVLLVSLLTTLLVASSIGSVLVWRQRQEAVAQRALVVEREADLRQRVYAGDIRAAHQAWQRGDVARAQELLDRYAPPAGDDVRDFAWRYLSSLLAARPAPVTVLRPGHGNIYCVQFSPDGKLLAAACGDGHVQLWNVADWSPRLAIKAHQADADCVAFSPDGKLLASGGEDGWLRLWNVETGELVRAIDSHQKDTLTIAISPDGQTVASGGIDGMVRFWRLSDGYLRGEFRASKGRVQHLAFSPDGKKLATAGGDGNTMIVDVATHARLCGLPSQAQAAYAVAFSPEADELALGSSTGLVVLADASSGRTEGLLGVRLAKVRAVAFSPTAPRLASAGQSGVVDLWDTSDRWLCAKLYGHERCVWSLSFSPDGKLLASGGDDGSVHVWNADDDSGQIHVENPEPIYAVKFEAGGKRLVTASDKHELATWDAATLDRLSAQSLPGRVPLSIAFAPDRRAFAAYSTEGEVWLSDTFDGATAPFGAVRKAPITMVALAGKPHLLVWYADRTLDIWNTAAQRLLDRRSLDYLPGSWPVAVSGDGRHAATTLSNAHERYSSLQFYEFEPLATRSVRMPYSTDFYAVALSPDNRWLAVTRADGAIDFYEPVTGEKTFSLAGHQSAADALAFSPDGRTLASASRGGAVRLWHLATRDELFVVRRIDMSDVPRIDFSPDGRRLAIATGDRDNHGHLYVWSTDSGSP